MYVGNYHIILFLFERGKFSLKSKMELLVLNIILLIPIDTDA